MYIILYVVVKSKEGMDLSVNSHKFLAFDFQKRIVLLESLWIFLLANEGTDSQCFLFHAF